MAVGCVGALLTPYLVTLTHKCALSLPLLLQVKEQIAQDKFGKGYDELTAHERIQVGGTKGGIVTKVRACSETANMYWVRECVHRAGYVLTDNARNGSIACSSSHLSYIAADI